MRRLPTVLTSRSPWLAGLACAAILPLLASACQTTAERGADPNATSTRPVQSSPARPVTPGAPIATRRLQTGAPVEVPPRRPYATGGTPTSPSLIAVEQAPRLTPPADAVAEPVKVGLLLPLTGRGSSVGQAMLDAASLALFDVGDERLQMLPRDTGGTPDGAAAAATSVLQEGAQIILGPLFGDAAVAAAPIVRARGVQMITFSTDRSVAGEGVYVFGFTPAQQVERVALYALSRGKTRFAALAPETPYGIAVVAALRVVLAQYGGEFVRAQYYAPDGSDANAAVKAFSGYDSRRQALQARKRFLARQNDARARRQLAALDKRDAIGKVDFDAVLLPEGGQVLTAVAPLLSYYDVDADGLQMLGTGLWDDPKVRLEPTLAGAWFASPAPDDAAYFRGRYKSTYGDAPPRIASLAYDAMALAAALGQMEGGPKYDGETLTLPSGFAGSDGVFRFRADGIAERGLAVLEVHPDRFEVISAAPNDFEALTN